jgi:uncharacterized protein YegP (UPF0339 family)
MWHYEIYADVSGQWRWRLRAENGRVTANSGESFHPRANAERAAAAVKAKAGSAQLPQENELGRALRELVTAQLRRGRY